MKNKLVSNKRGITPLILIVGAIILVSLIAGGISLGSIGGSSTNNPYIEVPYIPFLKCDLSGSTKDYTLDISSPGNWLQIPENTNGYSVRLLSEKQGTFSSKKRFEYYDCPQRSITTNCIHKITDWYGGGFDINFPVSKGRYVWAEYQAPKFPIGFKSVTGATYQIIYQPYTLQRTDLLRGSGEILGSEGCNVPEAEWSNRLISSFQGKNPSDGQRQLQPNEIFNYYSGTLTRMSQGNLESNGKYCIYSNGVGNLYPVVPISFASGNYNVVDVTRGNSGTQDCCSGDNLPDKTCINGVWIPTAKAECSVLDPCEGNEWRANYGTDNQKIRYECIESKCVAKIVNVDCNKDAGCKSTNLRCNPNTFTCEFASVGVDTPGTPVLSTTETECLKEGNKWIPKTTTKTGLLGGLIPFGGSTEVVEAHCEQSGINWTKIIIIVLIIAFLFFFRNYILAGLKSLRRLLPF